VSTRHTVLVLLAPLLLGAGASRADDVRVSAGWVRLPPPGANAAAFMTVENTGAKHLLLTGATSGCCSMVEIHRTVIADGVASMDEVDELKLEPGKPVHFAPRGMHVMLMRPGKLEEGALLALTLVFADGATHSIELPIRRTAP
jgi:copper(I)-binding protein